MTSSPPRPALRPATAAELSAALADTATRRPAVQIHGAGTAAGWGGPPEPADLVLDTTGLSGILRHNPADQTVAVRAGTVFADLQRELAEHGQRVGFDAARVAAGATVGGLLATADGGPAQQVYGTLRDLTIGATVALADGTLARSGGHVIKNVAGYDLAKLFVGSLGTLGVLAEVVLRLHPLPRATATLRVPGPLADAVALGGRIIAAGLEPAALEWSGHLLIRLEGTEPGVAARCRAVSRLAGEATDCSDADRTDWWSAVDRVALGAPGDTVLRIGGLPGVGGHLGILIDKLTDRHGLVAETASRVGVGVHTVRLSSGEPAGRGRFLDQLRSEAAQFGAVVTVTRRDGLPDGTDLWGPPPPTLPVLRAVKRQFDPTGRFGAGRLAPWL